MTIRLLLADDHAILRAGLKAMLERQPDLRVVAEATDGRSLLSAAQSAQPDVILLDIAMPELNGLEALPRLRECAPHAHVIVLSMHNVEEYVARALKAGAISYLLKDAPEADLLTAIRLAAQGQRYLCPPLTEEVIQDYLARLGQEANLLDRLSPREREVLQLMAEGHSTIAIAQRLNLSPKTVETHRSNLMDKLAIHDLPGLTRFALKNGLIA
jgi:DNA-binding NarL/FixJ family response regulator